jgi:hypothetical protein
MTVAAKDHHLGRLPSAPEKRTCRAGEMGREHAPLLFIRSKMGSHWETVGAFPVVRGILGYDFKDLSEIN